MLRVVYDCVLCTVICLVDHSQVWFLREVHVGVHTRDCRLGQISNNVPGKSPAGIFEEKEANHFF